MKKKPEIVIIVAASENRVIGINNTLPWHISEDLKRFKALTKGYPIVMGRKTYESLPKKPLPYRENIVITRNRSLEMGHKICHSLEEAVAHCAGKEKLFICGGAAIYREALPLADTIELTLVHQSIEGDTFFPEIDDSQWEKIGEQDNPEYSFITYRRK